MPKPHYTKFATSTQCKVSSCVQTYSPGCSNNPKEVQCSYFVYIFVIFVLYILFVTIFVCRVTLYFNSTMAEANGIHDLPKQGVQSILKGFSIDDIERSLPQVPNETLGLSSVSQTLSSSFNRLRRGITN